MTLDTDLATLWAPVVWGQAQTDALKRVEAALRDKDAEIERLQKWATDETERLDAVLTQAQDECVTLREELGAKDDEIERLTQEHDECKNLGLVGWRERAVAAERELARIQHLHHLAEIEARDLRAELARLREGLRELVEYLEEQDPFPTSDGHPLYKARALLAEDGAA